MSSDDQPPGILKRALARIISPSGNALPDRQGLPSPSHTFSQHSQVNMVVWFGISMCVMYIPIIGKETEHAYKSGGPCGQCSALRYGVVRARFSTPRLLGGALLAGWLVWRQAARVWGTAAQRCPALTYRHHRAR